MTEKVNKWFGYFSSNITLETKKRMLLRTSCLFWILSLLLSTGGQILIDHTNFQLDLIINLITCLVIVFIIVISLKGKEQLAGVLLPSMLLVNLILRAYFLSPSRDIELFLLAIGPFSIFYIKQNSLGNLLFGIAFCSSIFLPELLDIDTYFRDLFQFKILFVLLFVSVRDIDIINRQAEDILNSQKLQAEKGT